MSGLAAEKTALRREIFARRKAAHAGRDWRDPAANASLLDHLRRRPVEGVVIAGYRPIRTEIDPTEAMAALAAAGARLCVPVIEAEGAPLKFREWAEDAAMVEGPFGAMVPAAGAWLTPAVLIVPLLGWDRAGGRLGYGGGFYDRTLERLRVAGPARAIGFAYGAQELTAAPAGPFDQRLDAVITEDEVIETAI
ncbi:MAG: 5-formyltetrahydrofolate cyclo-ligase [Pikeienuella sp.]